MHVLRLAVRALRTSPVVSFVAILSLALGIGANTAIFSLVNSLLLRALPVKQPQRLVMLGEASAGGQQSWAYPLLGQSCHRPPPFARALAWSGGRVNPAARGRNALL